MRGLVSHVQLKTFGFSIVKHHRICCCIITALGFPRVKTQRGEIPALLGRNNKVCDVLQWKYQRF